VPIVLSISSVIPVLGYGKGPLPVKKPFQGESSQFLSLA
jgi:hypothetical protein